MLNIESIDLCGNKQFTDKSIQLLFLLKTIKYLNLQGIFQISDKCFSNINTPLLNLEELYLNGVWNISDNGVYNMISYIPNIEKLVILDSGISDISFKYFGELINLKYLKVGSYNVLSNDCIYYLIVKCKNLRDLEIGCFDNSIVNNISDEIISPLFETNPYIHRLSLCNSYVSGNTIPYNNNLYELYLINCKVNNESLKHILFASPFIRILDCSNNSLNNDENEDMYNILYKFCEKRCDLQLFVNAIGFDYKGNMSKYYQYLYKERINSERLAVMNISMGWYYYRLKVEAKLILKDLKKKAAERMSIIERLCINIQTLFRKKEAIKVANKIRLDNNRAGGLRLLLQAWHYRRRKVLFRVIQELEAMKIQSTYRSRVAPMLYYQYCLDYDVKCELSEDIQDYYIFFYLFIKYIYISLIYLFFYCEELM